MDDMSKKYQDVFEDMVKCYLENINEDKYDDEIKLSNSEIKQIAYKMIYKNEYIWEVINDTIDMYIGKILEERSGN